MKFDSILGSEFTIASFFFVIGVALACGLLMSFVYLFINKNNGYSNGIAVSLILLPVVVSSIILFVNNNWIVAFSVAGSIAFVRFRTTQDNPRDLVLIFAMIAAGVASGTGYVLAAALFTVIVSAILIILQLIGFAVPKNPMMRLKITIPESLNYIGVFDTVFSKYLTVWRLQKVKSTNFGTMFDLSFDVEFKKGISQKEFLDDLRTLNGNLNITLQNYIYKVED